MTRTTPLVTFETWPEFWHRLGNTYPLCDPRVHLSKRCGDRDDDEFWYYYGRCTLCALDRMSDSVTYSDRGVHYFRPVNKYPDHYERGNT